MDFKTNNTRFIYDTMTEEPKLALQTFNQWDRKVELLGAQEAIWQPYTKWVLITTNNYRITSPITGLISLPTAMYDNPNVEFNNNFDGTLDADNCSYDSFSHDESSDMDTFSDVDVIDNSDDEIIITAEGVEGQGCANSSYYSNDNTTTLLQTDTTLATSKLSKQDSIRAIINNIINNGARREGKKGRVEEEEEEQQNFFNFSQSQKAKPKLPGVKLVLQDLSSAAAASHSWEHVVDHKCEKNCKCMAGSYSMHSMYGMQVQNSF